MISLLPEKNLNEKSINLNTNFESKDRNYFIDNDLSTNIYFIKLRNKMLNLIDEMFTLSNEKITK